MAWERLSPESAEFTDDAPADAFAAAFEQIARAYLDRFSRRPTALELRAAFDSILRATPARWVEDPEQVAPGAAPPRRWLDADLFEAATGEQKGDVTPTFIVRRATGKDALRYEVAARARVLHVGFEAREPDLTEDDAWRLFASVFLRRHAGDHYASTTDTISFGPLAGERVARPYPRG